MTIWAALSTQLNATAGLVAIVGTKIYPVQADQSAALPYLTFSQVMRTPANVLNADPTLAEDHFQFSCWAATHLQAATMADAVKTAIRGFKGLMGGAGGVNVSGCIQIHQIDLYEGDSKTHHVAADYLIFHDAV